MFWMFYVIGGVIGGLIGLRFLLAIAYFDVKNAWGLWDVIKTIGYHLIRISLFTCVAFFVSWISVGNLLIHYCDFKSELERMKL
jgi:hypothetical protein